MGVYQLLADCGMCDQPFTANPLKVPTFIFKDEPAIGPGIRRLSTQGTRKPVCAHCFTAINQMRVKAGGEPLVISEDAYEAADESEML